MFFQQKRHLVAAMSTNLLKMTVKVALNVEKPEAVVLGYRCLNNGKAMQSKKECQKD